MFHVKYVINGQRVMTLVCVEVLICLSDKQCSSVTKTDRTEGSFYILELIGDGLKMWMKGVILKTYKLSFKFKKNVQKYT